MTDAAEHDPAHAFFARHRRTAAAVFPAIWAGLAAIAGSIVFALEPNVLEEGQVVHIAQRMADGEHLYRDIVYYTGPVPFELLALLFRMFGDHLILGRFVMLGFMALATGCVYSLARQGGARLLAHAIAAVWATAPVLLFPLLSIYFYSTLALYLVPVACYLALRGREALGFALAAGAVVAVVALCKQTLGVALAIALGAALVALATRRLRAVVAFAAGGAAVAAFTLGVYALRGDLGVFIYSLAQLPFELGSSFYAPSMSLWPPGVLSEEIRASAPLYLPLPVYLRAGFGADPGAGIVLATQALYVVPFVALIATLAVRVRGALAPVVWIHAAGLLAMVTNLYPRGDWGHLAFVLPAALTQLLLLVRARNPQAATSGGQRALAAVTCALLYTGTIVEGTWVKTLARLPTFGPEVPLQPVSLSTRTEALPRVIHYLRARVYPDEPIFVARQEPLLYVATGTKNPTPYTGVLLGIRERQQRDIVRALADVRYVVMSDIDQPLYAYYGEELPAVQKYLERHFAVPLDFEVEDLSWIHVLERRQDRGATLLDLIDQRGQARFWRRDRRGAIVAAPDAAPKLPSRQMRRLLGVVLGEGGGGVDYELDVPPGAVFQADVGLVTVVSHSKRHDHPGAARHALQISTDGGEFTPLRTVRVADLHRRHARRWRAFDVDLAPYAGKHVVLRLEIIADAPLSKDVLAWWGSPRIAAGGR